MANEPLCPACEGPIAIRNPTGSCDHLYWPDLLTPEARKKVEPMTDAEKIKALQNQIGGLALENDMLRERNRHGIAVLAEAEHFMAEAVEDWQQTRPEDLVTLQRIRDLIKTGS